jgi:hypothetical protein
VGSEDSRGNRAVSPSSSGTLPRGGPFGVSLVP